MAPLLLEEAVQSTSRESAPAVVSADECLVFLFSKQVQTVLSDDHQDAVLVFDVEGALDADEIEQGLQYLPGGVNGLKVEHDRFTGRVTAHTECVHIDGYLGSMVVQALIFGPDRLPNEAPVCLTNAFVAVRAWTYVLFSRPDVREAFLSMSPESVIRGPGTQSDADDDYLFELVDFFRGVLQDSHKLAEVFAFLTGRGLCQVSLEYQKTLRRFSIPILCYVTYLSRQNPFLARSFTSDCDAFVGRHGGYHEVDVTADRERRRSRVVAWRGDRKGHKKGVGPRSPMQRLLFVASR